jgi:hypothetical protein
MWEKVRQAILAICVVAIVSSVLIVGAPVLGRRDGASVDPAVLGDPWVKSGWKNGPVTVSRSFGDVASMALPAGKYVVFAKLWLWSDASGTHLTDCKLTLGGSWDWVYEETPQVNHEAIALNVAGELTQPGRVYLGCRTDAKGVSANWIKITAIRAGNLINVSL